MTFTVGFVAASGPSVLDCHFVVERWDAACGWGHEQSDFWLGEIAAGQARVLRSVDAPWRGLWRSPTGRIFVGASKHWDSVVHRARADEPWRSDVLDMALAGIFGVDDRCVIAWGDGKNGKRAMRRFDGEVWRDMAAPDGMQGARAFGRDLFAVGEDGLVARWDDGSWVRYKGRYGQSLKALARGATGELYVGGMDGLARSTPAAWEQLAEPDFDVEALAWFEGALWVGARKAGLLVEREGALSRIGPPELEPIGLEAGARLLVVSESSLADTEDGVSFRSLSSATVLPLLADAAPLWRTREDLGDR